MSAQKSDPSLAGLVAELKRFEPVEQTVILDALDSDHRIRIEALLADDTDSVDGRALPDVSLLSAWFADLVRSGRTMTPHAHRTLEDCARRLAEDVPKKYEPFRPSLMNLISARLAGRRPA